MSTEKEAASISPPSKWVTTIGAICDQFSGDVQTGPFGSQLHAADYSETGTPVVMPQDMIGGRIVCDRIARVSEKHVRALNRHVLRTGDLVFSRRGDVTRFAVVTEGEAGWLCGTGSIRIRLNSPDILIGYARRYLQQPEVGSWLLNEAKGVTMPNLNTQIIRALPFVFPPLEEQRRIAAILDQAETLRTQRRQALAHLDTLTQSLFLDMFGDPVENPKGFAPGVLGDVCDLFNGYAFKSDDYVEVSNTLNCRMSNIRPNGEFDIEYHAKYLPDSFAEEYKRFLLQDGDVIIAMTDMASEVKILGVPTIVDTKGKTVLLNQRVGKLLLRDRAEIDIPFLRQMLAQKYVKSFYQKFASGGVQINLGKGDLLSVPIVLPPLVLQQTFATRIQAIAALKATNRTALAELDVLFASLQQRAFAGRL